MFVFTDGWIGGSLLRFVNSYGILDNPLACSYIFFAVLLFLKEKNTKLRLPDSYEAKIAKIGNFWTFWPVIQLIYHLFKIQKRAFLPTLLRWKKCSDILKIASVGRGESEHVKACHFSHFQFQLCHQRSLLKCHHTFYIYGPLVKKLTFRFLKDCVLAVLSSKMYRRCPSNVLHDILVDN